MKKRAAATQAWLPISSVQWLAAFSAIGVPGKVDVTADERSGRKWVSKFLAVQNFAQQAAGEFGGFRVDTRKLVAALKRGELEAVDPNHPVLWAMSGLHNREMLIRFCQRGEVCGLRRAPKSARFVLRPVDGLTATGLEALGSFSTTDIRLASALATGGLPPISVAQDQETGGNPPVGLTHLVKQPHHSTCERLEYSVNALFLFLVPEVFMKV